MSYFRKSSTINLADFARAMPSRPPDTIADKLRTNMLTQNQTPLPLKEGRAKGGVTCPKCGHSHAPGSICAYSKSLIEWLDKANKTGNRGHSSTRNEDGTFAGSSGKIKTGLNKPSGPEAGGSDKPKVPETATASPPKPFDEQKTHGGGLGGQKIGLGKPESSGPVQEDPDAFWSEAQGEWGGPMSPQTQERERERIKPTAESPRVESQPELPPVGSSAQFGDLTYDPSENSFAEMEDDEWGGFGPPSKVVPGLAGHGARVQVEPNVDPRAQTMLAPVAPQQSQAGPVVQLGTPPQQTQPAPSSTTQMTTGVFANQPQTIQPDTTPPMTAATPAQPPSAMPGVPAPSAQGTAPAAKPALSQLSQGTALAAQGAAPSAKPAPKANTPVQSKVPPSRLGQRIASTVSSIAPSGGTAEALGRGTVAPGATFGPAMSAVAQPVHQLLSPLSRPKVPSKPQQKLQTQQQQNVQNQKAPLLSSWYQKKYGQPLQGRI